MIQTVNIMHASPQSHPRRARAMSSSSASATSYDAPKTPTDAYSGLGDGALGNEFSVLKMKDQKISAGHYYAERRPTDSDLDAIFSTDSSRAPRTAPLPAWLCDTVASLDAKHPLRIILPPVTTDTVSSSNPTKPDHSIDREKISAPTALSHEEGTEGLSVFAFGLPPEPHDYAQPCRQDSPLVNIEPARLRHIPSILDDNAYQAPTAPSSPCLTSDFSFNQNMSADNSIHLPFGQPGPASSALSYVAPAVKPILKDRCDDVLDLAGIHDSSAPAPFSKPGPLAPKQTYSFASTATVDTVLDRPKQLLSPPRLSHPNTAAASSPHAVPLSHLTIASPLSHYSMLHSDSDLLPDDAPVHNICGQSLNSVANAHVSNTHDLWSTPGPAHHAIIAAKGLAQPLFSAIASLSAVDCKAPQRTTPFKMYFDSPMEDPCMSDPLEEDDYVLALDYDIEALGFKWEKFERGGGSGRTQPDSDDQYHAAASDEIIFPYFNSQSPHTPSRVPVPASTARFSSLPSSSPPGLPIAGSDDEPSNVRDTDDLPEEDSWILPSRVGPYSYKITPGSLAEGCPTTTPPMQGRSFAPAPGIFISPLRGTLDRDVNEKASGTSQDDAANVLAPEVPQVRFQRH